MNMLLHGIGDIDVAPSIDPADVLIAPPKQTFDYVLTLNSNTCMKSTAQPNPQVK